MKLSLQKFSKFLLVFTTSIILSNCAYEFSKDSFLEVSQKPPSASVSLNSISDNQPFYVPTEITYNYQGNNKHLLYEINIYIDDNLIKTSEYNYGEFVIDTESLEDGNHILKVEYIFSSGTGSLADKSGVEAYIKTEEYNFTVDKSPPETIVMNSAEIIDGSIYLSWEPINKLNFDSAMLIITNNGSSNYFEITKQELLKLNYNDTNVHTFIPAGEEQTEHNIEYQIRLKNIRGNTVSNKVNIFTDKFEIKQIILNENQYKLIIPQHTLYNNFDYYLFTDQIGNSYKVNSTGGEMIVDKRIIIPDYDIGANFTLYEESGGQDIYKGSLYASESYFKHFQSDYGPGGYNKFLYNGSDGYTYTLRIDSACPACDDKITIEQRDSNDLSVLNSKQIARVNDYDVENLTIDSSTGNLIVDAGSISFLIDNNSLSIINQWSLSDFSEQSGSIFYINKIIGVEHSDKLSFYDSANKEQFYTLNKKGYFKKSANGRYFYVNGSIFEITNKSVNLVYTTETNNSINLVEFIESENLCVYNSYDGNPIMLNLITKEKSTLSDFTRINIMDYDKATNKLLFVRSEFGVNNAQSSYAYVYDIKTKNFKRIEVRNVISIFFPNRIPKAYWFQSDKLIYSHEPSLGFYLDHYINE